jgi:hypothetical protein
MDFIWLYDLEMACHALVNTSTIFRILEQDDGAMIRHKDGSSMYVRESARYIAQYIEILNRDDFSKSLGE